MKVLPHKLYRQLTPILFIPLLATALTGIIYGFSDRFFKLPNIITKSLIAIHQGLFLGEKISPIYALLMGLGVFALGLKALVESENFLLSWESPQQNTRNIYRLLVLIAAIPLAFCVETGVAYQIGRDWFGVSSQQTSVFLDIHSGNFFGKFLGLIYILITGLGLIALSIIGYKMTSLSVVQRKKNQQQFLEKPETLSDIHNRDSLIYEINFLRKNIRAAIYLFSLVFIAILYSATTKLFVSILIIAIIFIAPALVVSEKLIWSWQHQKEMQAKLYEQEAESITMLKAIPDSMLRVSQDGICLSYMPAKEGKCFITDGDIINKSLNEFLDSEIAQQFIKLIQLSLKTGSTHSHQFFISSDSEKVHYEARITPIGQTEVLIIVRESLDVNNYSLAEEEPVIPVQNNNQNKPIPILTEPELKAVLKTTLEDIQQTPKNHILFCLAIKQKEINSNEVSYIDDEIINKIVNRINIYLAFNIIARLDNNGLVVLLKDCSLQKASILADNLYYSINESHFALQNGISSIGVDIGLVEININSPDEISLMNKVRETCDMAKQKVNVPTS